ncbi:MAG: hypothetical protein DWQ01_11285 [Planctomycetota bacterium]|nr:MAG: hypothetical protein DWQ01_11285 [Planctomycetota bacterium]
MSQGKETLHPDERRPRFVRACAHLRTKTQYYRLEDQQQPPGMIADSPTLCYWCALTEDPVGPDGQGTSPGGCQASRSCHEQRPLDPA